MAKQLRLSLRISILLGIPGMAILGFGARYILQIFGSGYADVATLPMQLLVLTYLPAIPGSFYVAVCRANGKLTRAATVLTAFAVVNVIASVIGCLRGGLVGMTFAGLLVTMAEALFTTPAVMRAAAGYGQAPEGRRAEQFGCRGCRGCRGRRGIHGCCERAYDLVPRCLQERS